MLLPTKEESKTIYLNLIKYGVGGFQPNYYWSFSEYYYDSARAWEQISSITSGSRSPSPKV